MSYIPLLFFAIAVYFKKLFLTFKQLNTGTSEVFTLCILCLLNMMDSHQQRPTKTAASAIHVQ